MGNIDQIRDDSLDEQAVAWAKHLIRHYEGYRSEAYICPGGVLTIGYGHTVPGEWQEAGVITEDEAEMYLLEDILTAWYNVKHSIRPRLNSNQKAAIVSFVFNIGCGRFRSSTMLKLINERKFYEAGLELYQWVHAGGKVQPGLVKRRRAEAMVWAGSAPIRAIRRAEEEK